MKAKMKISLAILSTLLLGAILLAGCYVYLEYDPPDPHYVPVENVEIVSSSGIKIDNPGGVRGFNLQLKTVVSPATATNQNITWSVVEDGDGTGARFVRNVLVIPPDDDGTAPDTTILVRATITGGGKIRAEDYTKDFTIAVTGEFLPVTNIGGVVASWTTGDPLTLTGTVNPSDATAKQQLESESKPVITWSVKNAGGTGAVIAVVNDGADYILRTTTAGTVIVTATVQNGKAPGEDYTQDFEISVTGTFVAVTGMTNGPTAFVVGGPFDLAATVTPSNASRRDIVWELVDGGGTEASIHEGKLTTTSTGTTGVVIVRARIVDGRGAAGDYTKEFEIEIHTTVSAIAVTNITGVPTSTEARVPLALTGTVQPADATFKQIEWMVVNAGKTGAVITDGSLITAKRGTVTIRATIVNGEGAAGDYTQDFTIGVKGLAIYVAGCTGDNRGPCYWEIEAGIATRYDLPGSDGSYSIATGVAAADDGTVYISGYYDGGYYPGESGTGCYWTIPANDGAVTKTDLSAGPAMAITVSGGDVYVACRDGYYKNSTLTSLTKTIGDDWYRVSAIAVNGASVYVTGSYSLSYSGRACYWDETGAIHTLDGGTGYGTAGIAFMGSDVYIVGNSDCYWKNGTFSTLSFTGEYVTTGAIAVEGANWYVAGTYYNDGDYPCYWENGTMHSLSSIVRAGEIRAITVLNGNVYVAGTLSINYNAVPTYFVNGEYTTLGSYADGYGYNAASGIAVVDDR